ncbi:MAG: isoamylase early set domain-containing protein [Anaerolineae bacterium]|nr:isoamylase early set domain-containing protein [Anaerolineae bacterium]
MIRRDNVKGSDKLKVTFILGEDSPAASVVGDFNNWDPLVNPMKRRSNQKFSTSVILEPGKRYVFRYLAEGGGWFNDEDADAQEPNEFGGHNSVLLT